MPKPLTGSFGFPKVVFIAAATAVFFGCGGNPNVTRHLSSTQSFVDPLVWGDGSGGGTTSPIIISPDIPKPGDPAVTGGVGTGGVGTGGVGTGGVGTGGVGTGGVGTGGVGTGGVGTGDINDGRFPTDAVCRTESSQITLTFRDIRDEEFVSIGDLPFEKDCKKFKKGKEHKDHKSCGEHKKPKNHLRDRRDDRLSGFAIDIPNLHGKKIVDAEFHMDFKKSGNGHQGHRIMCLLDRGLCSGVLDDDEHEFWNDEEVSGCRLKPNPSIFRHFKISNGHFDCHHRHTRGKGHHKAFRMREFLEHSGFSLEDLLHDSEGGSLHFVIGSNIHITVESTLVLTVEQTVCE